jgi:hypothetical protein
MSRLSRQFGILNISQPYRPPRPVMGIALLYFLPNPSGPGDYSASIRNEYRKLKKKSFWGVKCGWCVGLITLSPSMSRLSRQCGILNISQPYRPPRPVTGIALLTFGAAARLRISIQGHMMGNSGEYLLQCQRISHEFTGD